MIPPTEQIEEYDQAVQDYKRALAGKPPTATYLSAWFVTTVFVWAFGVWAGTRSGWTIGVCAFVIQLVIGARWLALWLAWDQQCRRCERRLTALVEENSRGE